MSANPAIATACLESWSKSDLDATRAVLAHDVTFVGPLGATKGADEYVEEVRDGKVSSVRAFFDPRPLLA